MDGWMDGWIDRWVDKDRIAMIIIKLRIKKA